MLPNVREMEISLKELEELGKINYCVNCVEAATGVRGTFAYDEQLYEWGFGHWSISPIFNRVESFYAWAKDEGFLYHRLGELFVMTREFE